MAIQMNYLLDKGGFVSHGDGTFSVDFKKIKQAVIDLDREFLTIEATGDYARAKDDDGQVCGHPPGRAEGAGQDEVGAERYPSGLLDRCSPDALSVRAWGRTLVVQE